MTGDENDVQPEPQKIIALVPKPAPLDNRTAWTAEQMVVELLEEIRAGKIHPACMMVFFNNVEPDGRFRPTIYLQNVGFEERIAFFQLGIQTAIAEWQQR